MFVYWLIERNDDSERETAAETRAAAPAPADWHVLAILTVWCHHSNRRARARARQVNNSRPLPRIRSRGSRDKSSRNQFNLHRSFRCYDDRYDRYDCLGWDNRFFVSSITHRSRQLFAKKINAKELLTSWTSWTFDEWSERRSDVAPRRFFRSICLKIHWKRDDGRREKPQHHKHPRVFSWHWSRLAHRNQARRAKAASSRIAIYRPRGKREIWFLASAEFTCSSKFERLLLI